MIRNRIKLVRERNFKRRIIITRINDLTDFVDGVVTEDIRLGIKTKSIIMRIHTLLRTAKVMRIIPKQKRVGMRMK